MRKPSSPMTASRWGLILAPMLLLCLAASAVAADRARFDDGAIRETIKTLASDAYGGRAPGTPGEDLTIRFISSRLRDYGLSPADHGKFVQDVPLLEISSEPGAAMDITGGATVRLENGEDIAVTTPQTRSEVSLSGSPLVFAGYGIVAPEYRWDDYAGLDVRGKTVVVLVNDPGYATGDPKLFHGKAMTYYGRWSYKYEEAERHGAAAVLVVHETGAAGYPWEVVQNSSKGPLAELPPGDEPRLQVQGWIRHDSARRLFAAAGLDLDELASRAARPGFKAVDMKLAASLTLHSQVRRIVSHNVVALLKGTRKPQEVVVYSAHWDHLGTKVGPDGKPQIFHGAIDNASGVAGLLELARAFAGARPRPSRSVLFIATTAEEEGLLGAAYYAEHPLFPLSKTVANLNMDVMNMYGETRDLTVRGEFMSTLDDGLRQVAKRQGRGVLADAEPEKGFYFRGDNFQFAKLGVPALSIDGGPDYVGRPPGWGHLQLEAYIGQRYHKPADVYEPGWDLAGMHEELAVLYALGRQLADSNDWPSWYADSPFRGAREAQRRRHAPPSAPAPAQIVGGRR